MKANEAPAKLYVNSNDHLTYNGYYAFTNKMRACDIEYTRTDAFIEKDSLTWQDINLIHHLLFDIKKDYDNGKLDKEEYYKEVLKQFKEQL